MSETQQTVGEYLIQALYSRGARHIFGVPGDYVLGFYHVLSQSNKLKIINTCDEQGAGFAADAYARVNGLGAVCITYCVGGFKVVNPTAQAFAEKSPLVVISGAPGIQERKKNALLHHKVRNFDTQLEIFKQITVDSILIDDTTTASQRIDRVLSSVLRYKRPAYIELPRDMVSVPIFTPQQEQHQKKQLQQEQEQQRAYPSSPNETKMEIECTSDLISIYEALLEATAMINSSNKPVIVVGIEIHRFGLQEKLLQLIVKTGIPFVSTVLSKSVINEDHPSFLGVYEGAMGYESVREYVESSDCLILLGALMTDINFAISSNPIEQSRSIYVTSEKLSIKHHNFENIFLHDFINGLIEAPLARRDFIAFRKAGNNNKVQPLAVTSKKITAQRLFELLNYYLLTDKTIVIADVGDSLFGALDLKIHGQTEFLSPAYYCSMGFAVPASIGAQLANPRLRPIVIVGDGAFQMTGMEISTIARFNLNPVIIVLNNGGYGTERPMLDGPFNDILRWHYSLIAQLIGHGKGFVVETEEQFEEALSDVERKYSNVLCILDVRLDPLDGSQALKRLTEALAKNVRKNG
ncbi:MAG: thiamine pyrophosphate-binding protein [Candidatus Nitrosopolaris sp.]